MRRPPTDLTLRLLSLSVLLGPVPPVRAGLVGQWDFDDPADLTKATLGKPLVLQGTATAAAGLGSNDGAVEIGIGSFFRCAPDIPPNGGSTTFVNEFTLVFDILVPAPSDGEWRCLFQTNTNNVTDGDYFISPSNTLGVGEITYSGNPLPAEAWHRLVFSADIGSNIDGASPPASFLTTVTDVTGSSWTHRHASQALNGRHALRSTLNGNTVLLFADENGEDALLRVSRVQLYDSPLSAAAARALGGPFTPDPENVPPSVVPGPAGPLTATTGQIVSFVFLNADENDDLVMMTVDWGDGATSSGAFRPAGQATLLEHAWSQAGTYAIRVTARDEHGAASAQTELQSVVVTGSAVISLVTPPYLQNLRTDGIVIMTESAQNAALAVEFGPSLTYGSSAPMSRVGSGGGTWFHRAVLTGLDSGGEYFYRVTTAAGDPLTPAAHFHTAPAGEVDFKFSTWGDSQGHNHGAWRADPLEPTVSMMKHMVQSGVAFGLANGDMAEDGNSYSDTRSFYLDRVAAHLGTSVPWFTAWGNHDTSNPSSPLRLSSDMPSRYRPGFSPGHGSFSFTYSNCFFVCLDHFYKAEITNGWLEQQLASTAATTARFRFLGIHVPPYCERWIDGDATLRSTLVPLLEEYDVDVCFSGHTHEYERGDLNHVHYVVTGGGSWLDHPEVVVRNWEHMVVGGAHDVPGTWARESSLGVLGAPQPIIGGLFNEYVLVTIRDRFLKLEAHGFNADGSSIGVLDSVSIGVDPGPDTDGDGLRDQWEVANGLDPADATGANGATGDPDGDTQSNLAEFHAGTSPTDSTSVFAMIAVESIEAGLAVTWSSVPGKSYRLSTSPDLAVWTPLTEGGVEVVVGPATGPSTTRILSAPESPRLFVRVSIFSN